MGAGLRDVAEAIDFLEYYAREMIRLAAPRRMGDAPGEVNDTSTSPAAWPPSSRRGTSPWRSVRHGVGGPRHRQSASSTSRPTSPVVGHAAVRDSSAAGPAGGRLQLRPRPRRRYRRPPRGAPARSRSSPSPARWRSGSESSSGPAAPARPALRQEGHRRDGRQERHHHRRRRGPGRGRAAVLHPPSATRARSALPARASSWWTRIYDSAPWRALLARPRAASNRAGRRPRRLMAPVHRPPAREKV